jgi:NADPH2:quinone reductase
VQAGGAPEVFTTAHDALFTQSALSTGEHLLVHGGAGGVGTAAIQLGAVAGSRVTASVRNTALHGQVAALGADVVVPDEFAQRGPFDVIIELVGAPNMADNLNSLAMGGRISVIGIGAGAKADLHLGALMGKLGTVRGSMLRYRPLEGKAATARAMERHVLPLFEARRIHVPVAETFTLDDVGAAYERFAAGGKLGQSVVLTG